jgi:hypothetical protein
MFQNGVLRKISGSKRDEITEDCMGLHNEEFHDMCCAKNFIRLTKSRRMRWAGHVALLLKKRCAYRVWAGKNDGKRPLGRLRHRHEIILK